MSRILVLLACLICLTGCSIINQKEDRDKAIQECKNNGGVPYVENYNDDRYRPIVHCKFDGDE